MLTRLLTSLFIASVRANPGRTALSVAGIALGVTLGLAVHVINESAIGEMQQASRTLGGDADLSIRAGRESLGGFDQSVFETVLADPAVAVASPVLETDAPPVAELMATDANRIQRAKKSIKFIGIDVLRAARLQPGFVGEVDNTVSENSGDDVRFAIGDVVKLVGPNRAVRLRLASASARRAEYFT